MHLYRFPRQISQVDSVSNPGIHWGTKICMLVETEARVPLYSHPSTLPWDRSSLLPYTDLKFRYSPVDVRLQSPCHGLKAGSSLSGCSQDPVSKKFVYEVSHICGAAFCNKCDHFVLEHRRQNQVQQRCHNFQTTHHCLPRCLSTFLFAYQQSTAVHSPIKPANSVRWQGALGP